MVKEWGSQKVSKQDEDTGNLQIVKILISIACYSICYSFAIDFLKYVVAVKIRILNVIELVLYLLYNPYSFFKLSTFKLSIFCSFMSSYGVNAMILGYNVSGSTEAVHTEDMCFNPT